MNIVIRKVLNEQELETSVSVIRTSFLTVAEEFNITQQNATTNAAFIKHSDLLQMNAWGITMFGLFENEVQIGFVAVEQTEGSIFYMEKLAVLPAHRHRGYGKALIDFVCDYVKRQGGATVSIGIIDHHSVLKNWYQVCGFTITGTKEFRHLPFKVCFLSRLV